MTEAEFAFALETADLTLTAAAACGLAATLAGTIAVFHWTSRHRPPGKGWLTIAGLVLATAGLAFLSFEFFRLP